MCGGPPSTCDPKMVLHDSLWVLQGARCALLHDSLCVLQGALGVVLIYGSGVAPHATHHGGPERRPYDQDVGSDLCLASPTLRSYSSRTVRLGFVLTDHMLLVDVTGSTGLQPQRGSYGAQTIHQLYHGTTRSLGHHGTLISHLEASCDTHVTLPWS